MTYTEQRRADKLKERKEKKKVIKARSKKMTQAMIIYNRQKNEYLKENGFCGVIVCDNHSTDVHHKKGRGRHLLDKATWMPVCRSCHSDIEKNPKWAKENGYSLNRLT